MDKDPFSQRIRIPITGLSTPLAPENKKQNNLNLQPNLNLLDF